MHRFEDALELEYLDGRQWRVTADFFYATDVDAIGRVVVPAGFVTDFASIPRALWAILPPVGRYGLAAVIHDRLYRLGVTSRGDADRVLLEAMQVCGVSWIVRRLIYVGVRMGGASAWAGSASSKSGTTPGRM
jgi:hypothetical protein